MFFFNPGIQFIATVRPGARSSVPNAPVAGVVGGQRLLVIQVSAVVRASAKPWRGLLLTPGTIHSNKATGERRDRRERGMDASRLAGKVEVERAHDDARVPRCRCVQANEVFAIERDQGSPVSNSTLEHCLVR